MRLFAWILIVLAGCSQAPQSNSAESRATPSTAAIGQRPIVEADGQTASVGEQAPAIEDASRLPLPISLSLYLVVDGGEPGSVLSTVRTADELEQIAADIGKIWDQAGISFDPISIVEIKLPTDVIEAIALRRDTTPFFDQVGLAFDVPDPGLVNGFYVSAAGGVNGFTPLGSRVFFVVDEPSVLDERVSSHELGHILGLRHDLEDPDQLMFSGTNGMGLTEQEQEVARYGAEGLLQATR